MASLSQPYWLHVPKCGQSFKTHLVRWACPLDIVRNTTLWASDTRQSADWLLRTMCNVSPRFTQHHLALPRHDYAFDPSTLVTMLREPRQRIVSAFAFNLHMLKLNNQVRDLIESVALSPILFYALHMCGVQMHLLAGTGQELVGSFGRYPPRFKSLGFEKPLSFWHTASQFVLKPEHTEGTRAAEVAGEACSHAQLFDSLDFLIALNTTTAHDSASRTERWAAWVRARMSAMAQPSAFALDAMERAISRVEKAAFVGLTDQWALSFCVFEKKFGRFSNASRSPRRCSSSFRDLLHSKRQKVAGGGGGATRYASVNQGSDALAAELSSHGFVDVLDSIVYWRARRRLEGEAARYGCRRTEELSASGSKGELLEQEACYM